MGRFKTARRKKRLQKEGRDKQLVQLYRELEDISEQQRNLGYAELVPPVQRGWKRFFVLRPDVMKSKESEFFLGILEKINTVRYSHRKDFKVKRRRKGKKVQVDRIQLLRTIYDFELQKMTEKEKGFFKQEWEFIGHSTRILYKYVFTEAWRFVLKTEPNMITKVKIIDPVLKSRQDEIDMYLDRNGLYPRLFRQMTGSYKDGWAKSHPQKNRSALKRELNNELKSIND
ncbi:MAG TPA: hypothetical protein VK826_02095 [Bacteroidia bacterium]|nr:hypothetical protein [Bacteroidia bacterium]